MMSRHNPKDSINNSPPLYQGVRALYSVLFTLALPVIFLSKVWRSRKAPAYRQRFAERIGITTVKGPFDLWVHAVSLGEANVAIPLIERILKDQPDWRILVTTMTPTGSARVTQILKERVSHCYLPYDIPWVLTPWMKRIQAKQLAIIETELWPNLIHIAHRLGTRIHLLNARLSEKSAQGYAKVGFITKPMLERIDSIAAQDAETQTRLIRIGALPECVKVTGSIKFDVSPPTDIEAFSHQWKSLLNDRPVWIAASTHEGEEALLLEVQKELLNSHLFPIMIIAPRHPERFESVAQLLKQTGKTWVKRSEIHSVQATSYRLPEDTHYLLLDSLGELLNFYALAHIAVIGGSFIPQGGGHNPLEAIVHATPTITGPNVRDFKAIYQQLGSVSGSEIVENQQALFEQLKKAFLNPSDTKKRGEQGRAYLLNNQGATLAQASMILNSSVNNNV